MGMSGLVSQRQFAVISTQIVVSVIIVIVGLYQCIFTSPVDPLWVNLIIFVVSSFLPHPQTPKPSTYNNDVDVEDCDKDTSDGVSTEVTRATSKSPSNLRWGFFIAHLSLCLIVGAVGVIGLVFGSKKLHLLWASLIAFAVSCLLPTPLTLLTPSR